MRDWEKIVPEYDRRIYEKAGYKGKQPFGDAARSLLIIDVITAFTGTRPMETLDAIDEFRSSCGKGRVAGAVRTIREAARGVPQEQRWPVVYSTSDGRLQGGLRQRHQARRMEPTTASAKAVEFPQMIRPRKARSGWCTKARASAFFGTHLITYLTRKNIDSLIVTGASTSRLRPLHGHRRLFLRLSRIRGGRRHLRPHRSSPTS